MNVPVHTMQVKGFEHKSCNIFLLYQSLYDVKQAHWQYNGTHTTCLASISLHSTELENCLYTKHVGPNFFRSHMHVDDCLCVSNSANLLSDTFSQLEELYDVKWDAKSTKRLGIKSCGTMSAVSSN